MKRLIRNNSEAILGMANLSPKKTNLPVIIWADHNGVDRALSHRNSLRAKISQDKYSISISIEEEPRILAKSGKIPDSVMSDLKKGIKYIADNWDIFLQHYLDTDFSFDDDDLKDELRRRGYYK